MTFALLNVVLLLAAHHKQCLALAHSQGNIISRKSDGQYKTYSFDDWDEEGLDGLDCRGVEKHGQQNSFFRPSSALLRVRSAIRSTFLPSLPSGQGD